MHHELALRRGGNRRGHGCRGGGAEEVEQVRHVFVAPGRAGDRLERETEQYRAPAARRAVVLNRRRPAACIIHRHRRARAERPDQVWRLHPVNSFRAIVHGHAGTAREESRGRRRAGVAERIVVRERGVQLMVQEGPVRRRRAGRAIQIEGHVRAGHEQVAAGRQERRDSCLLGAAESFVVRGFVAAGPDDNGIIREEHLVVEDGFVLARVERPAIGADRLAVRHDVIKAVVPAPEHPLDGTAAVGREVILDANVLAEIRGAIQPVKRIDHQNPRLAICQRGAAADHFRGHGFAARVRRRDAEIIIHARRKIRKGAARDVANGERIAEAIAIRRTVENVIGWVLAAAENHRRGPGDRDLSARAGDGPDIGRRFGQEAQRRGAVGVELMEILDDRLHRGFAHRSARLRIAHQLGIARIIVIGDFDDRRVHFVIETAAGNLTVTAGVSDSGIVIPRQFQRGSAQRHEVVVHFAAGQLGQLGLVRRGIPRDQRHRAAPAARIRVEADVDAFVIQIVGRGITRAAVHLGGHLGRRRPTVLFIRARAVIERGGLSLGEVGLNPVTHALLLPGIIRHAAATIHRAHAVAEANGVRNHHCAVECAAQVADHHRTRRRVGPRIEVVFAEINPAVADHLMRDANLGFPARVPNAIQLVAAIGAVPRPAVNGIVTCHRDRRGVSGRRGFRGRQGCEAIRHIARAAPENRRSAVRPRTGERHRRVVVVENHLIGLMTERAHGNHRGPGVETIRGKEIQLVEVAVILVHLLQDGALQSPRRRIPGPPVAAVHENDPAGERARHRLRGGGEHAEGNGLRRSCPCVGGRQRFGPVRRANRRHLGLGWSQTIFVLLHYGWRDRWARYQRDGAETER